MAQERPRSQKFDVRWKAEDLELIREAAKIKHVDPSTFIRQQAISGAESVILEQQRIVLTDEQWLAVHEALERPARTLPNLAKLLAKPPKWDEE